jgi:hypothetical protein
LTGRNLPKIWQSREPEPSIINERTIADFTRVVEQTGILDRKRVAAPHDQEAPQDTHRPGAHGQPDRATVSQTVISSIEKYKVGYSGDSTSWNDAPQT